MITREEALGLLRQVVEGKPSDYDYEASLREIFDNDYEAHRSSIEGCFYTIAGQPACLVGKVLHEVGIDIPEGDDRNDDSIDRLWLKDQQVRDAFTPQAINVLRVAQRTQDVSGTWQYAVQRATNLTLEEEREVEAERHHYAALMDGLFR